jgi:hypothetical protein
VNGATEVSDVPGSVTTATDGVLESNGLMADARPLREPCHDLIEPAACGPAVGGPAGSLAQDGGLPG